MSGACKRFERPGREGLGLDGRALGTVTRSHLSASGSIDQSEQYQVWQRVAIDIYRERYVRRSLASLYRNRVWSAKYYTKKFVYLNYPLKFFQELLYRKRLKTRNNPLANKYFRGRYFLSCSEWGLKKKTLSSYEKSNPRILRSDALPLSHRDSGEKKLGKEIDSGEQGPSQSSFMTRVLHTAGISNIRASERGIRRSEVRFLTGTQNFFFVPRLWQNEKHLSLFLYRA